jgi:hypothetical protein
LQVIVFHTTRAIVEHQYCAGAPAEVLLERQYLTSVSQRILGDETQL